MKIVTTTSVFPPCYNLETATERLARTGFDALDLAFDYCVQEKDFPFMTDGWKEWAIRLKNKAEKCGVSFTHSHACGDAAARHDIFYRCFEACKILGIPYIVVHPVYHKTPTDAFVDEDEFVAVNKEAIKPVLEVAEKNNVTVLSENLLWGTSVQPHSISRLVEEVNSPYFGWCFDVGHAHAFGIESEALKPLSTVPLSLHIQDNNGDRRDDHLIPGDGTADWQEFMRVLKTVGYKGDFVLEAHHQALELPDEERDAFFVEIVSRSKKLIDFYKTL